MAYSIKVRQGFSAAHSLCGLKGKCGEMHGHNYVVEVTISGRKLKGPGMVEDFVKVKQALREVMPDHKLLNDVMAVPPTSEHLAKFLYDRLKRRYSVRKVTVWENDDCCATYIPEV